MRKKQTEGSRKLRAEERSPKGVSDEYRLSFD